MAVGWKSATHSSEKRFFCVFSLPIIQRSCAIFLKNEMVKIFWWLELYNSSKYDTPTTNQNTREETHICSFYFNHNGVLKLTRLSWEFPGDYFVDLIISSWDESREWPGGGHLVLAGHTSRGMTTRSMAGIVIGYSSDNPQYLWLWFY